MNYEIKTGEEINEFLIMVGRGEEATYYEDAIFLFEIHSDGHYICLYRQSNSVDDQRMRVLEVVDAMASAAMHINRRSS